MKRIGGRKGLGKKAEILIVGSGLAGMSAGRILSASGYQVTVFDKDFDAGGVTPRVVLTVSVLTMERPILNGLKFLKI